MNHDETKKALRCCIDRQCSKCPFNGMQQFCIEKLHYRLEDLLIANDKKIKKLEDECGNQSTYWSKHFESIFETAKKVVEIESVRRFAYMLQERCNSQEGCLYASDIGAVLNEWESEHQ